MNLLLHTCCAPCLVKCEETLQDENIIPTLFWYNPNIHPFTEYKSRKNTLIDYAKNKNLKLIIKDDYDLQEFIRNVYPNFNSRCGYCYQSRLEKAAEYASTNNFDYFSTTLLISPYQNHELIKKLGFELEKKYSVNFLYRDFRPYFRAGQKIAREIGLYMQKYCGCIFSEEERYLKK